MESTLTIHELIKTAKQKGYQALALSDHNVLYGAIEFYHLLLLAKNYEGYQALIQLYTMIQLSDQKAIALDEIIARSDHLVVIAPGDQGEIISFLKNKRIAEANEIKQYYKENIKDFYLGVSLQNNTEETLSYYKQNKEHLVALSNVQYLKPNDALPSKVLQVLNSDVPLGSENQAQIHQFLSQNDKDYSLKSPDEMIEQFRAVDLEEACETTEKIAENTDLKLELN